MLIKEVHIENFQSHKNTCVKFSKHLNAIIGSSRSGKSALLRAIFQMFDEYIPWNVCRRWNSDKTRIKIIGTNDTTLERIRSNDVNEYIINGIKEEFIGTNVPESVARLTNITEYNIQHQKDTFFLLNLKPGHLSKELNAISGLSIIDVVVKETSQRIRDAQAELRLLRSQQNSLSIEVEELRFIHRADALYSVIERIESKLSADIDLYNSLEIFDTQLSTINESINSLVIIDPKELNELAAVDISIEDDFRDYNELSKYARELNAINTQIATYSSLCKLPADTLEIMKECIENIEKDIELYTSIETYAGAFYSVTSEIKSAEQTLKKCKTELAKIKICPTCNKPL